MDFKKIRKSDNTLATWFLTAVLIFAIFFGMFQWWSYNISNSGQIMDTEYSDLNANLSASQTKLDNNIQEIRTDLGGAHEEERGFFATAINGLRGLGNTMLLPLKSIDLFSNLFTMFDKTFAFLPDWARSLPALALVVALVFLIFSILLGAPTNVSH